MSPHRCVLGESPTWCPEERRLYWIDIPRGQLLSVDEKGGDLRIVDCGEAIGALVRLADGGLALFTVQGRARRLDGGLSGPVTRVLKGQRNYRFNDAVTDATGRVLCGSMNLPPRQRGFGARVGARARRLTGMPRRPENGAVHRIDVDGSTNTLIASLERPNGMGFSPDGRLLYVTDSVPGRILVFDYELASGQASNPRTFATIDPAEGHPDGLTVDSEGCIWSAIMNGGSVVALDPRGARIGKLAVPARKVTSVAFGGESRTRLYITTAGGRGLPESTPTAGRLFCAEIGIPGLPEHAARIPLGMPA